LREAGFDFGHNVLVQVSELWTGSAKEAA
jgi:hypothetical protein